VPIITLIGIGLWQTLIPATGPTTLLLPRPDAILARFGEVVIDGSLPINVLITLAEVGAGFAIGVGAAFAIGYSIAHSRTLEQITAPYLVAFQALPIVAIAPALILWLGPGFTSNALLCAFIVFFPMLITTVVAIQGITPESRALMRSFGADRWQVFWLMELPAALPGLFGGLKVSVTLAVAGAVVAEAVTPIGGIGSLLYAARSRYDSPLAWVSVFSLTALTLALYGLVSALGRRWLVWNRRG
jgi:NitT/TauT family transport system permease protein